MIGVWNGLLLSIGQFFGGLTISVVIIMLVLIVVIIDALLDKYFE